jgi:thiol-disulfide isomerase/thioredoxin
MRKKRLLRRLFGLMALGFLALLLFTPLGFHFKVYANRLLSHNPTPVPERERQLLEAYDWSLRTLDGKGYNFEENRGQVCLINFWASWCPPCIAEMPALQKLYNDYRDKVSFLFVARDQKDNVEAFLQKEGYDLPVYYESGLVPKQLYYGGIPTTFIIDRDGRIVVSKVGAAEWNSKDTRQLLDSLIAR